MEEPLQLTVSATSVEVGATDQTQSQAGHRHQASAPGKKRIKWARDGSCAV
jgi:hypothetical protein